jgi:hypothetical protein
VSEPRISLITLSRDNPQELLRTAQSVFQQSVSPDSYIVLDSSDEAIRPAMKKIAESAGAKYFWTEPRGIYPAMVKSLDLIPHDSYCWWINSSDWLVGAESIKLAKEALRLSGEEVPWLIGQLVRVGPKDHTFHRINPSGEHFLKDMMFGRTGFPHPSTLFRTELLSQVKPFGDNLDIASDYSTALRFGKRFGPPKVIGVSLAAHVPNGYSAKHPVKNSLEKSKARRLEKLHNPLVETFITLRAGLVGLKNLVIQGDIGLSTPLSPGTDPGSNRHFCSQTSPSKWPECCNEVLDQPFS